MAWISDYKYKWYEKLAFNFLRAGAEVPRHIAFIMDGNRRFAQSEHLEKVEGHSRGFDKLSDCLRWCLDMGIKEVTTFAFSIENYKRSTDEVNGLFNLAREKISKLMEEKEKLHEHGVCVRVIGNLALLPKDLQILIAQVMLETEKNDNLALNIAFSYTSRDEITQAVETVLLMGDELQPDDIDEALLDKCLYLQHSSPPDLLFRTSGEMRISDFLMWQMRTTLLYFTKIYWPQLTIWNFLAGIFAYQRYSWQQKTVKCSVLQQDMVKQHHIFAEPIRRFLEKMERCRRKYLLQLCDG